MRDANRLQEIKRRIEWPLMIAAMTTLLAVGTLGCSADPLGPNVDRIQAAEVSELDQDAGQRANERQRDKNARNNGTAVRQ